MSPTNLPVKPRILVAPLDWGLGHATRCIPVIQQLITKECQVWLAGEGATGLMLRNAFPHLPFLPLQGYHMHYGNNSLGTITALVQQLPKLKKIIKHENGWLKKMMAAYAFDAVISDNRYGLYHPKAENIFITHQLLIKTPVGKWGDGLLQKFNYSYIKQFHQCWVPDLASEEINLAGKLAHPQVKPAVPVTYVGPLTRFTAPQDVLQHYILILLSGPEPQRTLLEQQLLQQLPDYKNPVLFVRGLPAQTGLPPVPYHVVIVNHLPPAILQQAIEGATMVIGRTGYSTIMDLMTLRKKSILIPTPGQTEQAYLAQHLYKNNWAFTLPQSRFNLEKAVALAAAFRYQLPEITNGNLLENAVTALLEKLQSRNKR